MDELLAWEVMVGVAGVLGLGWYFRETLKEVLPSPQRLAGLIRQRDLPLPTGERYVVLIADLQGDDDKTTHTRHVAAGRLKRLCANMPAGLEPGQRGSLWHGLGLAAAVLGEADRREPMA